MVNSNFYFSKEGLRADLKERTVRGGFFTAFAQALMLGTNLLAIPVLTRLLSPSDFGLVAMVTVFTGLAMMFVDAGLAMATVQRDEITEQQVNNLFWIASLLGLSIALVVCALAPVLGWFYGEPRLVEITIALSTAALFSGLTVQHQALLRRTMQLGRLAAVHAGSNLVAHIIAVGVAWFYKSYWALVVLPISAAALRMLGTWLACGWRSGLPRRGTGVRTMVNFGANLTGFNSINYFARSGDNMLIGWYWGDAALGYYERAYKLMMAPLQQISAPLAGVIVPALSRLTGEPEKYRTAYLATLAVFQSVSCPLMVLVGFTAPSLVRTVFGPGYEEAVSILRWLAVAGFLQPLIGSLGWLYVSQGRGRELMKWGLLGCSLTVVAFIAGLSQGPVGVARAYAVVMCGLIAPLAIWMAGSSGPVRRGDLVRSTGTVLIMALPTTVSTAFVVYLLDLRSPLLELAVALVASITVTAPLFLWTSFGRSVLLHFTSVLKARPRKGAETKVTAS